MKLDVHHTSLRANGEGIYNVNHFPFMLSPVEAFLRFFSRINLDSIDTRPFDCLRLNSFFQRFGELAQIFFLFLTLV